MSANAPQGFTPAGHPLVPDTASWARRVLALVLDWAASYGVTYFILRDVQHQAFSALSLSIFWLETAVGIALTGASFGQTIAKVEVHTLSNRPLTLLRALQRQLLVCLVIPPLVFRADGRGLHDLWTRSAAFNRKRA